MTRSRARPAAWGNRFVLAALLQDQSVVLRQQQDVRSPVVQRVTMSYRAHDRPYLVIILVNVVYSFILAHEDLQEKFGYPASHRMIESRASTITDP
jgi:hypothetical protein